MERSVAPRLRWVTRRLPTLGIAFALGWALGARRSAPPVNAPSAPPRPCAPETQASPTPAPEVSGAPTSPHTAALAACRALLSASVAQAHGTVIPWPESEPWASHYGEHDVQRAALDAIQACGLPLRLVRMDCAEFPCLVVFERLDDSDVTRSFLGGCDAWSAKFPDPGGGQSQGVVQTAGGPRRYWMSAVYPESWLTPEVEDNYVLRFHDRVQDQAAALEGAWDTGEPKP